MNIYGVKIDHPNQSWVNDNNWLFINCISYKVIQREIINKVSKNKNKIKLNNLRWISIIKALEYPIRSGGKWEKWGNQSKYLCVWND